MDTTSGPAIDQELVKRFRRGTGEDRRQAFHVLYERHAGALRCYLLRLARSSHTADDLTQEAFLRALNGLNSFSGNCSFKTWVYCIATNLLKDQLRKQGMPMAELGSHTDSELTPLGLAERNEEARRVREAVEALPWELRAPLVLVRLEGMKYREAAEVLGITLEALRMRVHRAYVALAVSLRE